MKASPSGNIQFISSFPGKTVSSEVHQRAHSHAARTAHAKARLLRTAKYQAEKAEHTSSELQGITDLETNLGGGLLPFSGASEDEKSILISPITLLAADRKDPFCSFAKAFDPVEHFLLDHYVRAVIPYMNISCNKLRDPTTYVDLMTSEWVRLTLTSAGSLNGIFLASCRHILQEQQHHQQHYIQLATKYKLLSVTALREAISSETSSVISDSTFSINILLAYDELQLGDIPAWKCHARGLVKMVQHNGGPQTMGTNGFLERLVSKFIGNLEPMYKSMVTLEPWCRFQGEGRAFEPA